MNFDDIRPYRDAEIKDVIQELLADDRFAKGLYSLLTEEELVQHMRRNLSEVENVYDIQSRIMHPLLRRLFSFNTDGETCRGVDVLDKSKSHVFISNHRDIILDAAFLNVLMHENGMSTTEIAIGGNLLIYDWIEYVVRCNRAFIVKRNLPIKELLAASRKLSHYIRETVTQRDTSVWIAQREGRTKDGNDQTQAAMLKMLNMSNKKDIEEGFQELRLVPLSISYEIEPCGWSKVKELMGKKDNPKYVKTLEDDLRAMDASLEDPVGRVDFNFGTPIDIDAVDFGDAKHTNAKLNVLAKHLDEQIYKNYKLWPNNYVAYDWLNNTNKYKGEYTTEDKKSFEELTQQRLGKLGKPSEETIQYWLRMYANPVVNKEKVSNVLI
ncbi:MAG: glycerol acyltransferase [Aureispira sp.]|nr:glycerol acyltransferase [Aureispira sp.]